MQQRMIIVQILKRMDGRMVIRTYILIAHLVCFTTTTINTFIKETTKTQKFGSCSSFHI